MLSRSSEDRYGYPAQNVERGDRKEQKKVVSKNGERRLQAANTDKAMLRDSDTRKPRMTRRLHNLAEYLRSRGKWCNKSDSKIVRRISSGYTQDQLSIDEYRCYRPSIPFLVAKTADRKTRRVHHAMHCLSIDFERR